MGLRGGLLWAVCVSLAYGGVIASSAEVLKEVHHPAPREPRFLSIHAYEAFKKALPLPPPAGSAEQQQDERVLRELQAARSAQDCAAAESEVFVSLQSFYGGQQGFLNDAQVQRLAPFFEQVRNDADYFIQRLKVDFPRKRPFLYVAGVTPCVPREVTGAYPSGHAVLAKLFALLIADVDGAQRERLEKRSVEIGRHRVLSGMHHPSDVEAGRALAVLIHAELQKSAAYKAAFAQARKEWRSQP